MKCCQLESTIAFCALLLLCALDAASAGDRTKPKLKIEVQSIASGDSQWNWGQARTEILPDDSGRSITTLSQTAKTGVHGYHDVFASISRDRGRTWSSPAPIHTLRRVRAADGSDRVPTDLWPRYHAPTRTVLILGKVFCFEGGTRENPLREQVAYAAYNPATETCRPLRTLEMPAADHEGHAFTAANAGCNQSVCRSNGDILLPVRYRKDPDTRRYTSIVTRCEFDGSTLKYRSHGTEHTWPTGRGLYEPSLGEFAARYYLTMRADDGACVTRGDDGEHFVEHRPWKFDDGQVLGSENTQQHWLTVGGNLHLVYTRRGAQNDDVFRFRSPLFIGQVDPERLCVVRATEQTVFPNDGGLWGNFGVCRVSTGEGWITCAEEGLDKGVRRGQNNRVLLARITPAE